MNTEDLTTALIQIANYQYFLAHYPKVGVCICVSVDNFLFVGLFKPFCCICIPLQICQNSGVAREKEQQIWV